MTLLDNVCVDHDLTFTDMFCGAGGSSSGLTRAGFRLVTGLNHWDRAIETHAANFPDADHMCEDVNAIDMRRLTRTRLLWASPICTEASPSGGNKAESAQLDLLAQGHIAKAGFVRTRATFWDVLRAAELHRYDAVVVENVVEVTKKWPLFWTFIDGMKVLGYNVQFLSVSSAHVGDENNPHAPQWRDRLYMVFTRVGIPLPNLDPRPLSYCQKCDEVVPALQVFKKDVGVRRIGKYGQQYVYKCPNQACRHAIVEPYVRPAAAAIDLTDPGVRIGDRESLGMRKLEASTMRRIQVGLDMFAPATVVAAHGHTYERPGSGYTRAWPVLDAPLNARTGTPGDGIAREPFTVPCGGTWRDDPDPVLQAPMGARTTRDTDGLVSPPFMVSTNHGKDANGRQYLATEAPLATRSTKIGEGIVQQEPFVTMLRKNGTATSISEPLATMAASGNHHALTMPPGAFLSKHHGGLDYKNIGHMNKGLDEPMPTVVAKPNVSLVIPPLVIPYRRGSKPHRADGAPLSAVATREQHGLMVPGGDCEIAVVDIQDCYFRMLQWREHANAQRFPEDYEFKGNNGERTMQAGNAVSSNVAQMIGQRLAEVLG